MTLRLAVAALVIGAFALGWWLGRQPALDTGAGDRIASVEKQLADLTAEVARIADALRPPATDGPDPEKVYEIAAAGSPSVGPEDAAVTIVEFFDFECAFSAGAVETLERILDAYPGRVSVVFKHHPLPFHQRAELAHRAAAAAAQQGRFWEMYRRLFENQDALDLESFRGHAGALGLDLASFEAAMESKPVLDAIRADQVLAGRLGIRGVPSFFINGRFMAGAQPYEVFRERIEEELRRS